MNLKSTVSAGRGFPNKMIAKLKYVDHFRYDATGTMGTYRFSANGLYDPDITGTGHQPMYFDQYMAIYDHYTVLGSKIKVKMGYSSSGNVNAQVAACIMSNDSTTTAVSDITGVSEQSQASRTILLDPFNAKTLTKTYSAKRVFGGNILSRNELRGDASSNPTEDWYYDLKYQAIGGVNVNVVYYVEIEYLVCFTELKDIGQS